MICECAQTKKIYLWFVVPNHQPGWAPAKSEKVQWILEDENDESRQVVYCFTQILLNKR